MNKLEVFNHDSFGSVRTLTENGVPWFVAADVCRALEHSNTTMALERLDNDERAKFNLGHPMNETNFVNEPGLYTLVLGSRKPEAKAFKRWITHDVIPSIRKHGAYMTPQTIDRMMQSPEFGIKLLTALKEERDKRVMLEQKVEAFKPVQDYVQQILSSKGTLTTTQIAADYNISANKLNKILCEERIQRKVNNQWILYSQHMGKGYTESETIQVTRSDGRPDTVMHTRWTQRGRLMIHELLTKRGIFARFVEQEDAAV